MLEVKRICCGIDFGEPSRNAIAFAADLARRYGAELTLVHVHAPPVPAATELFVAPPDLGEAAAAEAARMIEVDRREAEALVGRSVTAGVLLGDPAAELVRFALEDGADLLVLGTHGRRGVSRLVLGSVAERVAREAPCPVLISKGARLAREEARDAETAPAEMAAPRPV